MKSSMSDTSSETTDHPKRFCDAAHPRFPEALFPEGKILEFREELSPITAVGYEATALSLILPFTGLTLHNHLCCS